MSAPGRGKKNFKNAVLAIGVFDGVHLGHQALIKAAIRRARIIHGDPVVMTFMPHPVSVLRPEIRLAYINSLPYRIRLIQELGAGCIVVPFTKQFSRLTPQKFIERCLVKYVQPKEIFVGDDFRFGRNRGGTLNGFQAAGQNHGFKVNVVSVVKGGRKKIGSSAIRRLIIQGKLRAASKLLGRNFAIMGRVVKGDGRGKRLGFPTANIHIGRELVPPLGVYAVKVRVGARIFHGMANVGRRPSFCGPYGDVNVEAHLFGFKGTLYRKEIIVEFIKKIRNEKTFASPDQLTARLQNDKRKAQPILREISAVSL
jgi:riboflavin kinase/FMN adenylyltransferase